MKETYCPTCGALPLTFTANTGYLFWCHRCGTIVEDDPEYFEAPTIRIPSVIELVQKLARDGTA
jgi:hypothetical protein